MVIVVRFNNVLSAYMLIGLLDKSCRTDVSSHFQLALESSKSCGNSGLLFFCQTYVLTLLEAASEKTCDTFTDYFKEETG